MPASVTFIDIAGLVKGAHEGQGLGNQFLGYIREVDAIVHVVRVFEDPNVPHVHEKIDPKEDIEIVNLELELGGITGKPAIYVVNVNESQLKEAEKIAGSIRLEVGEAPVIIVCAKLEEELTDLEPKERGEYLKELGITYTGFEQLVREAYKILGLVSFYTIKGGKEVHAWSLRKGSKAIDAAAEVHSDFAKNFIKAEVISIDELLRAGGWKEAKEKGQVRLEGKDYFVQDRDVIEFKIGS